MTLRLQLRLSRESLINHHGVFMTAVGTDYKQLSKSALIKRTVRSIVALPVINPLVVAVLQALPETPWMSRIPVLSSGTLLLTDSLTVEMLRADHCDVAKELYWGKGALHAPCDRLALNLATGLSSDADVFLDIGAYTGLFALAVARKNPNIRCDAYEIVPENFQLMWQNIIANNLVSRVMPRLLGLGAAAGSLNVPASLGSGTLASSVALDSVAPDGVAIPIAALDDVYAGFNGKMVIKIDVEGFEWAVFSGGLQLLRSVKPDMVCEVLRRAPNIAEMQLFLEEAGYRNFHITNKGLVPSKNIKPVKNERDWLFTTKTAAELSALGYPVLENA